MTNIEKIEKLRQEATSLLIISNAIVEEIWDLDANLIKASANDKQRLLTQKEALEKKLSKEDYDKKIKDLKEQIYELEMKEYGTSDILKESPAPGNILI